MNWLGLVRTGLNPHLICFALLQLVENRNKNRNNLLFSAMFLRIFIPKPLSYGDELPAFAVLASPDEGYIYCVRTWNKGLSAEPEVVLRVNPDVPRSEERRLPCWRGMSHYRAGSLQPHRLAGVSGRHSHASCFCVGTPHPYPSCQ